MGLGVAALGMAIVLSSEPGVAQDASQDTGRSSMTTDEGVSSSSTAETEAQERLDVARLRTQVARLQQQLAQTRAELARASSPPSDASEQGVGGSGNSGTASSSDRGGATNTSPASSVSSDGSSGFARANILHTGRVGSVSSSQLVLEEEAGGSTTLSLARDVEVLRGGRPMALGDLEAGTRVRASANLVAPGHPVTRIEVLPGR
jgi:hypothetical protein